MKISKILLSAILIGITVQTTSCVKDRKSKANSKQEKKETKDSDYQGCPACGMG